MHDDPSPRSIPRAALALSGLAAAGLGWRRIRSRRSADRVHAPGHRHRTPPPEIAEPHTRDPSVDRAQPWIRTSHSDSQKRRFRR